MHFTFNEDYLNSNFRRTTNKLNMITEHKDGNIILYRKGLYQTVYNNQTSCRDCIAFNIEILDCRYFKIPGVRNNGFPNHRGCFKIQGIKRCFIIL